MNSLVTYWVLSVVVVMGLSYGLYRAAPCVLVVIAALVMNLVSMLLATVRAGGSPNSRLFVIAALYACSALVLLCITTWLFRARVSPMQLVATRQSVGVAVGLLLFLTGINLFAAACVARLWSKPSPEGIRCPACTYRIDNISSPRCPECGEPVADLRTRVTAVSRENGGALWSGLFRHPGLLCVALALGGFAIMLAFAPALWHLGFTPWAFSYVCCDRLGPDRGNDAYSLLLNWCYQARSGLTVPQGYVRNVLGPPDLAVQDATSSTWYYLLSMKGQDPRGLVAILDFREGRLSPDSGLDHTEEISPGSYRVFGQYKGTVIKVLTARKR